MRRHISKAIVAGAVSAFPLAAVSPALAGPPPSSMATNGCSSLDGSLAAQPPGTKAFSTLTGETLSHGCTAYVATGPNPSPSVLDLEFIRGPLTGGVITIGSTGVDLTDIALTASGTLYGVSFTDFYTIDPSTGVATDVGSIGSPGVNALVVGPTGTIYAADYVTGNLLTINPGSGAGTVVGETGFSSSGDLAFGSNGNLYMTADAPSDVLVTVNPTTGTGTPVGSIGDSFVYGLVSSYGQLFGTDTSGNLLTINASTGAGSIVSSGGPFSYGMASPPNET